VDILSNGLALATLLAAIVILALGAAVLVRARASLVSVLFALVAFFAAAWLTCFAGMYSSSSPAEALLWARVASLFACFVPAAVLHFGAVYAGQRQAFRLAVLLGWLFCGAIAIVSTTSAFTRDVRLMSWGYYPRGHLYNIAWVAIFLSLFIIAIRMMSRSASALKGVDRDRARALIRAFAVGSIAFVDFLPTIGVPVFPLGFIAILGFSGIAADALWRYHLAELTPGFAASQILATMKGAVIVADLQGKIRVVNRAALTMLGYEADEELNGKAIRNIIIGDENASSDRLMQSGGVLDMQMTWRRKNGDSVDVVVSSSFVRANDGAPVGIVYAATDITERRRAEQALRESEHRYRTLFEGNPLPMWVFDLESLRFAAVNEAAVKHYGYSKDEFLRMIVTDIQPREDRGALQAALKNLRDQEIDRLYRHVKKDGTTIDVDVSSYEFVTAGRRARLVIAVDVTERERAEHRLRESEERYRLLFERNLAGVYRTTVDGKVLDVNESLATIFGYTRDELMTSPATSVYFDEEERKRLVSQLRQQKRLSNLEVRMRHRDGRQIWVLENMTLLEGPDGGVIEGTILDITDRKAAIDQIAYQAYHDVLTGLPNRLLFRDRITVALAHARRTQRMTAVMFLDLDQFKLVNDTLGHTVGDSLLQAVAERLKKCVRAEDTVARMGGDEFTILLSDVADGRAVRTVAGKVLEAISAPVMVEEHELFATTSIGIALFPDHGTDAEALLKRADRAMYRAKDAGRNNFQFATRGTTDVLSDRLSLERSMHYATERDEFVLHYQPVIEIASSRVVGSEALIRWNHPIRGMMAPDEFIPVAEECGLIVRMGEWVLRTACADTFRWRAEGQERLRVAVNLSARQFQQRDLPTVIDRVLQETGFPAESLDIEITESTAMQNADLTLSILKKLKDMGVHISIDDFGTGYSSLSYLKRFPIDTVKIDQDFVRDLTSDGNDAAIVSAIISMARALKLQVVAEGVESEEQLEFLRNHECELVQGFLYSPPIGAAEFGAFRMPSS
jgi:diguanylate cyclase (GGDEF)-like protein/PAS domain S-box-containing protein